MYCRGNQHVIGFSGRLHARGDVGCIAELVGLITAAVATTEPVWIPTRTDSVTLCSLARRPFSELTSSTIARPARTARSASSSCASGEVNHQTIAEVLGDVTAKACDRCGRGSLILRSYLAPLFGIQMSRNFG
jgi:hypothetical protein